MNDFGYIVVNTRGHERFTDPQTERCNICDELTAAECVCGRCLDLNPFTDDEVHRANVVDSDPHRWNGLTYEDDPSPFSEATPRKDRTSVGGWYLGRRGYLGRLR